MKILPYFLCMIFATGLFAQQPVVFTGQPSLLNPISGFEYNQCVVDMNGDYLDDVVRATPERLYLDFQQADGSFAQQSFDIFFYNLPSWSICAGDIDDNGYNDLLFGDGDAVSFVKANGDGTAYTEIPFPEFIFSQRSTFADIDNDGHLDAFVCHDVDQSHPYRNDGNGNMVLDQTLIETIDQPGNYAAIWVDYDNDWDTDLYVTKCRGGALPGDPTRTNRLYRNNGDGTYSEVGAEAGLDDNAQSWSTVFEDFDNDGDFDAFIVNHDFQNRFFQNNGDGTFTDIIASTGINPNDLGAWENASGDFNNDGFMDIFSELSQRLYLNNGDLTFTGQNAPVTPGAIGDLNNDGFLDVKSGNIFLNNGNSNNWLKVNTLGIFSNRNAIGARVEIHGDWGIQIREVRSGQSFSPMSSLQIHFGIGTATEVDSLVVKFPSGMSRTIVGPAINTTHDVAEVECLLSNVDLVTSGPTAICPGGEVVISLPAGYTSAEWSNGATGTSVTATGAGVFSAILFAADGCVAFSNQLAVSVIQEGAPTVAVDGPKSFCEGGSVTLTATGGTDFTWSNGMTGPSITVTESGSYIVSSIGECTSTPFASEAVVIDALQADAPIVADPVVGALSGTSVTLTVDGQGGQVYWYDEPADGTLLGTGESYETPVIIFFGDLFYPEARFTHPGEEQSGGKPNNAGAGGLPSQGGGYLIFDAWEPFTLHSVKVYVPATAPSGMRTIQLVDEFEQVLATASVNLSAGEHVLEIDFPVPVADNLSLRCVESNLYRNSSDVNYPYPLGEVGQIKNSSQGSTFYYYFYDWKIRKENIECISTRPEIEVYAVVATEEQFEAAGVSFSPNPVDHQLFVKMEKPAAFVRLLNLAGQEILRSKTAGNETVTLDVSAFAAGIYTLQVETNGQLLSSKVAVY